MKARPQNILNDPPRAHILMFNPKSGWFPMAWLHPKYNTIWYTHDIVSFPDGVPVSRDFTEFFKRPYLFRDSFDLIEQC